MVAEFKQGFSITALAVLLSGCGDYRSQPLDGDHELSRLEARDVPGILDQLPAPPQDVASTSAQKAVPRDQPLSEAQLVSLALAFNPDLRSRRYSATQLGWLGLASAVRLQPEMHVNMRSMDAGFSMGSEEIYTLLVPSARHAWLAADEARLRQARADLLAAECQLACTVRHAHVEMRLAWQHQRLLERQEAALNQLVRVLTQAAPAQQDELGSVLARWQLAELHRDEITGLARCDSARRALNVLLGLNPEYPLQIADLTVPLPAVTLVQISDQDIDRSILRGRWELQSSSAQFQRDDYEARRKDFERLPSLRVAPELTYDRQYGTSFTLGASMRIPWPGHAQEEYENARVQLEHDRAHFISLVQRFRGDAHEALAHMQESAAQLKLHQDDLGPAAEQAGDVAERAWKAQQLSTRDYLAVVAQRHHDEMESLQVQENWLQASIDLDYATGRLNRIQDPGAGAGVE